MAVIFKRSPNQSSRPSDEISLLVLHADAGKTDQGTISWILSPESKVSYHYFLTRAGLIYQFVADDAKAWHAGVSSFKGRANCNNYSLGVSFANAQKGEQFTAGQLDAGVKLVAELCQRYSIPLARITTHAVISPGRKTDPGELFPLTDFLTRVADLLL